MSDAIDKVLETLEQVRDEARDRDTVLGKRLDTIDGRLENLDRTDTAIRHQVQTVQTRLSTLENRMGRLEDESNRAKRESIEGDQAQGAALQAAMTHTADTLAKFQKDTKTSLAAQTETIDAIKTATDKQTETLVLIHENLQKVVGHPMVRRIAWGIGMLIVGWLASKGVKW